MKNQPLSRGNDKSQAGFTGVGFLSLFILSAAFITGCEKDTPLGVDHQAKPEPEQNAEVENLPSISVDLETATFSFNGKHLAKEEFQGVLGSNASLIIVAGTGLPEANVVYAFDSETAFEGWARTTRLAEQLAQMSQHTSQTGAAKVLGPGGWARLYDGNLSGSSVLYFSPRLVSFLGSFNDRTSSVSVFAGSIATGCALYQHINYGGRRLVLTSGTPGLLVNFSQSVLSYFGFNNFASSVIL
jgi:hypothetical protein